MQRSAAYRNTAIYAHEKSLPSVLQMHEAERKRCVTVGMLALTVERKKGNLEGKTDLAHHTRWAHPIYAVGVRKVANGQA